MEVHIFMEKTKYYLGLDLGTSSVGWAVTDSQYQLLRAKGKDLWGVRLFEKVKLQQEGVQIEFLEEDGKEKLQELDY